MAHWIEHQTLGNIVELGFFLGCGLDATKTIEFIFSLSFVKILKTIIYFS